jgi:pimeloyl-ACP methyl ester carboxylesterase
MAKEFVLVHGASHGAWCWEEVRRRLEAKGHRVVAPDLPGHGPRAPDARRASVESYARAVAGEMARDGVSRGIVVGHSLGGAVIAKLAEVAPARIARLVFLASTVPPHGGSVMECYLPEPRREALRGMARGRGDGTFLHPAEAAWARWMGDLPRAHPAVTRALRALTPQSLAPFVERLDLRVFYAMRVPRTLIRCRRDQALPAAAAAEGAARLGVTPIDLDCAHDAMLSAPEALVRILDGLD